MEMISRCVPRHQLGPSRTVEVQQPQVRDRARQSVQWVRAVITRVPSCMCGTRASLTIERFLGAYTILAAALCSGVAGAAHRAWRLRCRRHVTPLAAARGKAGQLHAHRHRAGEVSQWFEQFQRRQCVVVE